MSEVCYLLIAGDSPAHPFSTGADDEDSQGYAEKLVKGLIPGNESEEDLASLVSPR